MEKALPFAIMLMSAGAALGYAACGDLRHCIYWASAAAITATVTL